MKFKAIAVVTLGVGAVLGLTKAQAASRTASVQPITDREGWYISTAQVQFKLGEDFLYEGDLPKSLAEQLEWEDKPKAAPAGGDTKADRKARAKAEAEANGSAGAAGNQAPLGQQGQ